MEVIMPLTRCKGCGKVYEENTNGVQIKPCPRCLNFGLKKPECTCQCIRLYSEMVLNIIWASNNKCPVHGKKFLDCGCEVSKTSLILGFVEKINPNCLIHNKKYSKGANNG